MRAAGIIALCVALCASVGCGKDDAGDNGDKPATKPADDKSKPAPPPAKPFEGALTYDRMRTAKGTVRPGDAWDAAFAAVQATAGKPTSADGDKQYWHLLAGNKCHELVVENTGGQVGQISLGTFDKIMKSKYDKCLAVPSGADDGSPAPDPAAAGANPATGTDKTGDGGW